MTLKFSGEQDTAEEDSAQIDVYRKSEFFRALANMYLFNPILASLSEAVWIVQTSENLVLPHAALTEKESSVRLPDKIAFFNLNFFLLDAIHFFASGEVSTLPRDFTLQHSDPAAPQNNFGRCLNQTLGFCFLFVYRR